jgi:hypothetical protein
MTLPEVLQSWVVDDRLQWALLLVALDFIAGVGAAVKLGILRLSYIADFLRNDVIFKVGGWGLLYVGSKFAPDSSALPLDIGFDLDALQNAAWAAAVAALTFSILKSLRDLGLFGDAPARQPLVAKDVIAGPDPSTPMP